MAVITGVLNEIGPGVEDLKNRRVYREFLDIGNSHLRKIEQMLTWGIFLRNLWGLILR